MLIFKLIYMVVALEDDKVLLTLKGIKTMDKCQK
jgi:hypothetical protein